MTKPLQIVPSAAPPSDPRRGLPRAKQFPFVESPAIVMLTPMSLHKEAEWWSHDEVLIGGIEINKATEIPAGEELHTHIGYMPILVPRTWSETEFRVVVEYESEQPSARFKFRLFYGCGDPSELHVGETSPIEGSSGGKQRMTFTLNEHYLDRAELYRCTLDVVRSSPDPILIYGAWLEVGID